MHNQRVEGGAGFGLENTGNGVAITGVCTKAVDGLGRECDKPAVTQDFGGAIDACILGIQHLGCYIFHV